MKYIILSADGPCYLYSVPDEVADNLEQYCIEFCTEWLTESPDAQKYRTNQGLCYNQEDFIEYLNNYVFPNQKSAFIKDLGWDGDSLPEYKNYPYFNF